MTTDRAPVGERLEARVPDVSVVIVNYNGRALLNACLRSVLATAGALRVEVIVVDNASTDGSADMVAQEFPSVVLIRNAENRWLAPADNQGLAQAEGRHLLFLNPDTELYAGTMATLVSFLDLHPDVGMAGAQLRNTDGSLQPSGNPLPLASEFLLDALPLARVGVQRTPRWHATPRDYEQVQDVGEVCGACAMMPRRVMERVGMLDERLPYSYEDLDLCIRVRQAGWRIVYVPMAKALHHGGQSVPSDAHVLRRHWERSQLHFVRKHHGLPVALLLRLLLALRRGARRVVISGRR